MLNGELHATGLDLNFYASTDFETETAENTLEENQRINTRNLLRVLMMGWTDNWRRLLTSQTFNAVFVERDHQLTRAMRYSFQQGFQHVFSQLDGRQLTTLEKNQADLFLSNCLTYLPFADISPYESMAIPQYVDDRWQLIDYKIVPIELTPTSGLKKLFLADHDRVFAYGLEPIHNTQAESHLVFMGTTYPAGQGFFTTINTDLEAFETAGKKLYRSGQANINRWLNQQTNKIHVCGTSLGGGLAQLLAIDQGGNTFEGGATFSRFDALNPPGLYNPFRKSRFDHWDSFETKPPVYIQKQGDDAVSSFGVWKPEWHVLHVTAPENKKGPNSAADHALNYAGFSGTQFIGVDTAEDNEERKNRNWWLYTLLRSLVYYTTLVPIRYLVLPPVRFILSHKILLLIIVFFMALFSLLPGISFAASLSGLLHPIFPASMLGYIVTSLIEFLTDRVTHKHLSDLSNYLTLLGQHPALMVTTIVFLVTITAAIISSMVMFPSITPILVFAFAASPVVVMLVARLVESVRIVFGYNEVQAPTSQSPDLERNTELDIYKNDIETSFSYKDMHDYYQIKRALKGKSALPEEDKTFQDTNYTKREVILKGQNEVTKNDTITFFATKAKAHDMQRTLNHLHRPQNQPNQTELHDHLQHYMAGKHGSYPG
jgi:hypothetical protein